MNSHELTIKTKITTETPLATLLALRQELETALEITEDVTPERTERLQRTLSLVAFELTQREKETAAELSVAV